MNKKNILSISICFIVFIVVINILIIKLDNTYKLNYNHKLKSIIYEINEVYPDVDNNEIIKILNSEENEYDLNEYGIYDTEHIIDKNNKDCNKYLIVINIAIIVFIITIIIIYLAIKRNNKKRINDIIKLLEQINNKNYDLDISDNKEDIISILKNELYKTTIILKEQANNEFKDKKNLKKSLEDISHQIKTPLTSINIMIDNIIDNPDMEEEIREYFFNEIKREITNINFLVLSLLKLSRFDVNEVKYNNSINLVNDIINDSIKNVSILKELKNIDININDNNIKLYCDYTWQVEAITNILKNSIEYSDNNSSIDITVKDNKIYTSIIIKDYGKGISKKDIKHIFDRFYKANNSNNDSIGIGLALSKSIIENNNGIITVESMLGEYTKFIIKYFK